MKVERSSGNVFRDLGVGPKEAESLRLRAELMVELKRLIKARKLTQSVAAKLFGVAQPRVTDLVRGRIDLFSIEALVNMLARPEEELSSDSRALLPSESASRLNGRLRPNGPAARVVEGQMRGTGRIFKARLHLLDRIQPSRQRASRERED